MDQGKYSVRQYLQDGTHQYVSTAVSLNQAVEDFSNCVVAASTKRVIVTDGQIRVQWTQEGGFRKG